MTSAFQPPFQLIYIASGINVQTGFTDKDRKRKKQCVRAHKRLEQYRKLGYKI